MGLAAAVFILSLNVVYMLKLQLREQDCLYFRITDNFNYCMYLYVGK